MIAVYPTILTQLEDAVLVEVPDLSILTEGKNISDAIAMARDAIGLAGITKQDMGVDIPSASAIDAIDPLKGAFAEEGRGIVTLVDIDFDAYRRKVEKKMVRRNVTLPSWLNTMADEAHINVSGILQEALKAKLGVA